MASLPQLHRSQGLYRDLCLLPRVDTGLLGGGGAYISVVSPQQRIEGELPRANSRALESDGWAGLRGNALGEFAMARASGVLGPRSPGRQKTPVKGMPQHHRKTSTTQQLSRFQRSGIPIYLLALHFPRLFLLHTRTISLPTQIRFLVFLHTL